MDSAQSADKCFQFLFEFSVPDWSKRDGYGLMAHLSSVSQGAAVPQCFFLAKARSPLAVSQEGIFPR